MNEPVLLYLDLLKRCLTNVIYEDPSLPMPWDESDDETDTIFEFERRSRGDDWPVQAHTMIGLRRLDQIEALLGDVLRRKVPGDIIEAGVGRGGATIFMRAVLAAYGERERRVFVADSFEGLPRPSASWLSARSYQSPQFVAARRNENRQRLRRTVVRLSRGALLEDVRQNFQRYRLLDDQVVFLPGWFHETLSSAGQLAFVRIDADLYDSTSQALELLYPKLSPGGWVIIDDYHVFEECRAAVHDFLNRDGELVRLDNINNDDGGAVCWMKPAGAARDVTS